MRQAKVLPLLAFVILFAFADEAFAEIHKINILDSVIDEYKKSAGQWSGVLTRFAKKLFWSLAGIEFAWTGIQLAIRGSDLQEIVGELVKRILHIGFFLLLIEKSGEWSFDVVNSFRQAANAANQVSGLPQNITPSSIFDIGLILCLKITEGISFFSPGDSLAIVISSLIVFICFALIAATLTMALVESYIVLNAGIIFLGFGGSRFTNEYALKYLSYVVAIGAKLYVMQLIVGVGETLILKWLSAFEQNNVDALVMIGTSIVLLVLIKSIPEMIQGLICGTSLGSSSLIPAMASAGGAAVGAAAAVTAGAAGATLAVREAAKLSAAQGSGGAMQMLGGMARSLAGAASQDIGGRLSGHHSTRSGTTGGRMASRMRDARMSLGSSGNTISGASSDSNPSYASPLNNYGTGGNDELDWQ